MHISYYTMHSSTVERISPAPADKRGTIDWP